ncbi:chemotaxis protein CheW [Pleurocapsales cyanobacterium LEGE 10410]|nr:chemotaxis protein CheW [Pleurocapsales cyanobacterium LEGE 10410]
MVTNSELYTDSGLDLSLDIQPLENPEGELHLRFYLASGEACAFPATGIAEVMQQTPDQIAPIPNASPLLLGTINLRGRVIWVADLGQFLGDSGVLKTDRPAIPVIAIEDREQILGLAISSIGDMDWLNVEQLEIYHPPADKMAPFVQAQWLPESEDSLIVNLLDPAKILRSARWAT